MNHVWIKIYEKKVFPCCLFFFSYSHTLYIYIYILAGSPMVWETRVQSLVEPHQRLKKCYLMLACSALSTIRWGSRVKWSNPGNGVAPSPTPWCSSYWKGEPLGHPQLRSPTLYIYIYIYIYTDDCSRGWPEASLFDSY